MELVRGGGYPCPTDIEQGRDACVTLPDDFPFNNFAEELGVSYETIQGLVSEMTGRDPISLEATVTARLDQLQQDMRNLVTSVKQSLQKRREEELSFEQINTLSYCREGLYIGIIDNHVVIYKGETIDGQRVSMSYNCSSDDYLSVEAVAAFVEKTTFLYGLRRALRVISSPPDSRSTHLYNYPILKRIVDAEVPPDDVPLVTFQHMAMCALTRQNYDRRNMEEALESLAQQEQKEYRQAKLLGSLLPEEHPLRVKIEGERTRFQVMQKIAKDFYTLVDVRYDQIYPDFNQQLSILRLLGYYSDVWDKVSSLVEQLSNPGKLMHAALTLQDCERLGITTEDDKGAFLEEARDRDFVRFFPPLYWDERERVSSRGTAVDLMQKVLPNFVYSREERTTVASSSERVQQYLAEQDPQALIAEVKLRIQNEIALSRLDQNVTVFKGGSFQDTTKFDRILGEILWEAPSALYDSSKPTQSLDASEKITALQQVVNRHLDSLRLDTSNAAIFSAKRLVCDALVVICMDHLASVEKTNFFPQDTATTLINPAEVQEMGQVLLEQKKEEFRKETRMRIAFHAMKELLRSYLAVDSYIRQVESSEEEYSEWKLMLSLLQSVGIPMHSAL